MYKFGLFLSFINKSIALLIIFALLSVSFSFNINANIKEEFNSLYKTTSISEYYNSIANFSYGIINKILESTKIVLKDTASKNSSKGKKNNTKQNNKIEFVKVENEKELKAVNTFSDNDLSFVYTFGSSTKIMNILKTFVLDFYTLFLNKQNLLFCYFPRGNIDTNININSIIEEIRLV
ncbi:MAG: hypothetical protein II669_00075 [Elusimicrobia bacterium]|nr:hypothetical protein [Elusimicrobiota bacterium]